jgi:hypothetical protein
VATISVGRARRRKTNTVNTASTAPNTSENSVSWTASRISVVKSRNARCSPSVIPSGRLFSIAASRRYTSSTIATELLPDCFRMPIPIVSLPL